MVKMLVPPPTRRLFRSSYVQMGEQVTKAQDRTASMEQRRLVTRLDVRLPQEHWWSSPEASSLGQACCSLHLWAEKKDSVCSIELNRHL